ncbi:hypothetical protein QZH41_007641 [Actinostola sp. cb2023]|nr:hypothetical protein QZH41_007641 [Actinostola sp. cb2023]
MYWIHLLLVLAPLTNSLTCNKPVGIEDRTIPDQSFQASSEYSRFQAASEARLNNVKRADIGEGAWCAKMYGDELKYLQVDLGSVRKLGYVLIQGRNTTYPQYVTQFRVSVSTLGRVFAILSDPLSPGTPKLFAGNKDKNTVVKVDIRKGPLSTVTARYIRIYITKFYANPCMRIELLECQATVTTTAAPVSSTAAPVPSTAANSTTTVVPFCPDGHRLGKDNKTCVDIDECAGPSPTARCNLTSTSCSNTDGGFKCVCKKGYKRQDPLTCVDIDECAGPSPIARCDLTSTSCSNTVGGFKCVCKKGYKRQDPLTCVGKT